MNAEVEGCAAAARFRKEHRLGVQPLGDLIAIIEQAIGIDVAVLDAGPDEHGLTMRDPKRNMMFVGVARSRRPMRQRSTLAHELGHVQFGDWADADAGDLSARSPAEIRADAFARHLLLPMEGLRDFLDEREQPTTRSVLSVVVQRFLVSPAVAAIALHQGGYIDAATKTEWMALSAPQLAVRFGWIDQYQALQADSDKRRAPQRLLARATKGYVEGVLPVQAIANLRGIAAEAAEAELRDAGVVPVDRPIAWLDAAELPGVPIDMAALDADLSEPDNPPDRGIEADIP
ncbi:ImmA/IrrE family metallo-endopeptidase [Micromonospora sp. NPDC047467]|uniref:ImmA/IrrE family metallo-endopeptidase n=1 Tax=Micromonospora sp. NPDC047467 TaxID=3154814 RepID=UPI0034098BED